MAHNVFNRKHYLISEVPAARGAASSLSIARLERLRAEIQKGTYHVPSKDLAEAIMRSIFGRRESLN